jgi:hypothetical protein
MKTNNQDMDDSAVSDAHNMQSRHQTLFWWGIVTEIFFSIAFMFGIVGAGTILLVMFVAKNRVVPIEIHGAWLAALGLVCLGPLYVLRKHINRRMKETRHHREGENGSKLTHND